MPLPDPAQSSFRDPVVEGFTIESVRAGEEAHIRDVAGSVLGAGWEIAPFGDQGTDYEVTSPRAAGISPAEAWQLAYALRQHPGIVFAEPLFAVRAPEEEGPAAGGFESTGGGEDTHLPASKPLDWSVKLARVPEAWELFRAKGLTPGAGVVVGHPDTGYRRHPEIADNLLISLSRDYLDGDADAEDDLQNPGNVVLHHPSHGTGTASVIVSSRRTGAGAAGGDVVGVAPGAKLIPLRVARSVVLVSTVNLARAIEYSADAGAHVVSISMGGLGSSRLRKAVLYAQRRGVIVLAAAGNKVRFVVWPAAYEEVVAVAACNADVRRWSGSSRGAAVDVTGPGESVWRARTDLQGGAELHGVGQGSGTSYAVATVAGVAALWLSYHGRDSLVQRYGAEKIPFIFNQLLRSTAVPKPALGAGFGRGLVDALALLQAPLPGAPGGLESASVAPAPNLEAHPPVDNGGIDTFAHLFGGAATESGFESLGTAPPPAVAPPLGRLFEVGPEELPLRLREVGQELAFHLATDPELHLRFEAMLGEGAAAGSAAEAIRSELRARGSEALAQRLGGAGRA